MLRVAALKRSRGKCTSVLQTASLGRRNKLGYCAVTNFMCRVVDRGTFHIMNVISRTATHLNEEREQRGAKRPLLPPSFPQLRQGPGPSRSACQSPRSHSIKDCQDFQEESHRPSSLSPNLFLQRISKTWRE